MVYCNGHKLFIACRAQFHPLAQPPSYSRNIKNAFESEAPLHSHKLQIPAGHSPSSVLSSILMHSTPNEVSIELAGNIAQWKSSSASTCVGNLQL